MGEDEENIVITVNEVAAVLETDFGIDVDPITVRRRGFHNRGYYERKYADICSYNQMGDTRMRGLIVKPRKFIEEVAE